MIPKIIHYCWFGGKELPALEQRCLNSWAEKLPDYEIKRWDESNFDISLYPFALEAYRQKKFAFVADVARLHVLETEGGIYLDTDIEVLKSFNDLLTNNLVMGFETDDVIQTGVIAAREHNPIISEMLDYYRRKSGFDLVADGSVPNSALFAKVFESMNVPLQNQVYQSPDLMLLPSEYLCPIDQATWEIKVTDKTYCIHYLAGSWLGTKDRLSRKIKSFIGKYMGFDTVRKIRAIFR